MIFMIFTFDFLQQPMDQCNINYFQSCNMISPNGIILNNYIDIESLDDFLENSDTFYVSQSISYYFGDTNRSCIHNEGQYQHYIDSEQKLEEVKKEYPVGASVKIYIFKDKTQSCYYEKEIRNNYTRYVVDICCMVFFLILTLLTCCKCTCTRDNRNRLNIEMHSYNYEPIGQNGPNGPIGPIAGRGQNGPIAGPGYQNV